MELFHRAQKNPIYEQGRFANKEVVPEISSDHKASSRMNAFAVGGESGLERSPDGSVRGQTAWAPSRKVEMERLGLSKRLGKHEMGLL